MSRTHKAIVSGHYAPTHSAKKPTVLTSAKTLSIAFGNHTSTASLTAYAERTLRLFPELLSFELKGKTLSFEGKSDLYTLSLRRMKIEENPIGAFNARTSLHLKDGDVPATTAVSEGESEFEALLHTVPFRIPESIPVKDFLYALEGEIAAERKEDRPPQGLLQIRDWFDGVFKINALRESYLRVFNPVIMESEMLQDSYKDYLEPVKDKFLKIVDEGIRDAAGRLSIYKAFGVKPKAHARDYDNARQSLEQATHNMRLAYERSEQAGQACPMDKKLQKKLARLRKLLTKAEKFSLELTANLEGLPKDDELTIMRQLVAAEKAGTLDKAQLLDAANAIGDPKGFERRYEYAGGEDFKRLPGIYFLLKGVRYPGKKGYTWA